ncbi:MAG TPA: cyclic nucleotide-binding domain-containing protein [Candidatus Sulfotelmatobacter sp.]|nr:cyclic nucleotide-binding domain-containing protein [Candidatus Sulfotelmatobacter sp.]
MKLREKTFNRDDIVFHEGDVADCVYMVVSGRVQLTKSGVNGQVPLALLGPQELFGEMGPFDDSPRNASARAVEKTRVKIVPKEQFRTWIADEPEAALRIIGTLVERLRAADEMIARLGGSILTGAAASAAVKAAETAAAAARAAEAIPPSEAKRMGLMEAVVSLIRRRKDNALMDGDGPVPAFQIGVCAVNNDYEGAWTRALATLLEGRPGVEVRLVAHSLQIDPGADQTQAAAAVMRARQVLAYEDRLDLLVWGDVHEEGFSLWFTSTGMADDERPGSFSPFIALELAGSLEPPVGELFHAAVLAAVEPLNEGQRVLQRLYLPSALQMLPGFPDGLPVAWSLEQQRTALMAYGHGLATMAAWEADADVFDRAAECYRAAIMRLSPEISHGVVEAVMRRHLGGAALAAGDRRKDAAYLEYAIGEFRGAVDCLFKGAYPYEWGGAQNRLGLALYKLDLLTGQPELLKESLSALQSALTVFNKAEQPQRWADVMGNLAQVLQVYGDQMRNPDVLERAVEACRAVLEIRSRDRAPLPHAAAQNSLGTALFLWDKHSRTDIHREEAREALNAALEIYRSMGAARLAAVTEKNLGHLDKLVKGLPERKVANLGWASEEDE